MGKSVHCGKYLAKRVWWNVSQKYPLLFALISYTPEGLFGSQASQETWDHEVAGCEMLAEIVIINNSLGYVSSEFSFGESLTMIFF